MRVYIRHQYLRKQNSVPINKSIFRCLKHKVPEKVPLFQRYPNFVTKLRRISRGQRRRQRGGQGCLPPVEKLPLPPERTGVGTGTSDPAAAGPII